MRQVKRVNIGYLSDKKLKEKLDLVKDKTGERKRKRVIEMVRLRLTNTIIMLLILMLLEKLVANVVVLIIYLQIAKLCKISFSFQAYVYFSYILYAYA